MIKGQHRKMFRKPGLARQALGILASSPELMQTVDQPRMRMAHAGAVNKSLFDQATQMVDSMIADQGRITLPLRMKAGIGTLPAGTGNQPFYTPGSREEGINAVYRDLMAQQQSIQVPRAQIGSRLGPEGDEPSFLQKIGRGLSYRMDQAKADPGSLRNTLARATGGGSLSGILDPQAELERREQVERAEDVIAANTPAPKATVTPDKGLPGLSAAAADGTNARLDQDETANDEVAELQERLEALEEENKRLSELPTPEEKEAIDPFLERYKEMTGNDEDDFYQAMMTAGLTIAGGESDDPVMNVARGALAGLQQYSKGKKDRRDSLFLAEIQARRLKAAETPAQVKLLEYLQDNPEAQKAYERLNIKDRSTETERDLVSLAKQFGLSGPQSRQLQLEIEIAKSYGDTIDIAERAREIKSGRATVAK